MRGERRDERREVRSEVRGESKAYMPEFPPVTMNTLPLRSGRVSGWKVMFKVIPTVSTQRWVNRNT